MMYVGGIMNTLRGILNTVGMLSTVKDIMMQCNQ